MCKMWGKGKWNDTLSGALILLNSQIHTWFIGHLWRRLEDLVKLYSKSRLATKPTLILAFQESCFSMILFKLNGGIYLAINPQRGTMRCPKVRGRWWGSTKNRRISSVALLWDYGNRNQRGQQMPLTAIGKPAQREPGDANRSTPGTR